MGETPEPVIPGFNRSLRLESRADRLTGDPGAVLLREVLERSGIVAWMTARLNDPRRKLDVTHDLASLIRISVLLSAQGWRDHDDADALRQDPAFRLAASSAAGLTPEGPGLASQPTLSRFTAIMAEPANIKVLREAVLEMAGLEMAGRGIRAERQGRASGQTDAVRHARHRQRPRRGPRPPAESGVERPLQRPDPSPFDHLGRRDGRHAGCPAQGGQSRHRRGRA